MTIMNAGLHGQTSAGSLYMFQDQALSGTLESPSEMLDGERLGDIKAITCACNRSASIACIQAVQG